MLAECDPLKKLTRQLFRINSVWNNHPVKLFRINSVWNNRHVKLFRINSVWNNRPVKCFQNVIVTPSYCII